MSSDAVLAACAQALADAEATRQTIAPLTQGRPGLTEKDAYRIQALRLQLRGRRSVGFKLGYTSAAMRAQMGIDHPNFGILTDDMAVDGETGRVDTSALIHPRVEPEIAMLTGKDLSGPGLGRHDVMLGIEAVLPAIEIVDTRYHEYRFSAVDNIADNSSAARFAVGRPRLLTAGRAPRDIAVQLFGDGQMLDEGIGANALGDPIDAVAWLANFLGETGETLPAGSIILTGGLSRSYPASAGQTFQAKFDGLGDVTVRF